MPHKCPKCGDEFPTPSKLAAHLNRKIPCDEGKYQCDGCKHKFTTWAARHRHIKHNACKGPHKTVEQAQEQVERLERELAEKDEAHQQQLGLINQASGAAVQHITNNITNNLVIKIDNLNVHNSVGHEDKAHFKNLTLSDLGLQLRKDPSTFARWCEILRADDQHPENHNVLLVDMDAKDAVMCDEGKWKTMERDEILLHLARKDTTSLYNLLERFGDEASEFRFDYLLHDIMVKVANGDKAALKSVMTAMAEPLVDLTKRLYAQQGECSANDSKLKAAEQVMQEIIEDQKRHQQKQAELLAKFAALQT